MTDDRIIRPTFGDPPMTVDRLEPICLHKFIVATWRERERAELNERIELLKTEETNLKSRIRNARKQTEQPVEKVAECFAEWLRRLNAAEDWAAMREADRWAEAFNWLSAEQRKQINDARFRAKQRSEAAQRNHTGKRRAVKVIKGGAS